MNAEMQFDSEDTALYFFVAKDALLWEKLDMMIQMEARLTRSLSNLADYGS